MGWKLIISFRCVCNTGSLGSSQLSQKCRLLHSVKRSWTSAFFGFRTFLRNATIGFFEEDRLIFILRRSLIGFRPICTLHEYDPRATTYPHAGYQLSTARSRNVSETAIVAAENAKPAKTGCKAPCCGQHFRFSCFARQYLTTNLVPENIPPVCRIC